MRLSLWLFLVLGACWGVVFAGVVPDALRERLRHELHGEPFRLNRDPEDRLTVTEARWLFVPLLFGDFDLQMDVELGEGVDLDLLLRRVEPRRRRVEDVLPQFAGRFSVLRLSADGGAAGAAEPVGGWASRDVAVQNARGDGVALAAGYPATVWVEARGRELRANVAGKQLPPFEADDVYGMFTMLVKGGDAVVHRLEIRPLASAGAWLWSRWTWAGLGLLGAALAAAVTGGLSRRPRPIVAGLLTLLFTWLLVRRVDVEFRLPELSTMLVAFGALVTFAHVLLLDDARWWWRLPMIALTFTLGVLGFGGFAPEHAAIDALFGEKAGSQIAEAHGQLVRNPTGGLYDVEHEGPCVFLLGGEPVYNLGAPQDHVSLQLERLLRGHLRQPVEVPSLPTVDAWSRQQWRLFDACYQGYEPRVVVFGIGGFEDVEDPRTGGPRTTPEQLYETLQQVREDCRRRGRGLMLYASAEAPEPLQRQLRRFEGPELPVVVAGDGEEPEAIARRMVDALLPLLR